MARARRRGRPPGGSTAIVRGVLDTTLEQLGARGYSALSIDGVAKAAGVNKTTIYRRWRTKADLVIAAVVASKETTKQPPETGDLERDLVALLSAKARFISTPRQHTITCAIIALDREVGGALTAELRRRRYAMPRDILERAIARGELPRGTDPAVVSELMMAPVYYRALVLRERVPPQLIRDAVAHVLAGARARKPR
jgi:AcrR family transcriptional regulator|nr:TetR/AcrR family transcriptional regulator [Kofleriaceae bacterium]